jgi:hypothetical protein
VKKVILHIGFHKTGTSALQEYFSENRETLKKHGVFYPQSLNEKYSGNVDLSWVFNENAPSYAKLNPDEKIQIETFYKEQIEKTDCETVIISSEDFSLLDAQLKSIECLKSFLSGYEVTIIAYVREPMEFMFSLYSHAVRSGLLTCSFQTYISKHYNFRAADFALRLQSWRRIFPESSFVVKKFASKEFYGGALVSDFFHSIGVDIELDMTMSRSNVGIHPWLIQSYIESVKSDVDETKKERILRKIVKLGSEFPKANAAKFLLDDEVHALITSILKPSLNKLRREYDIEFSQ